MTMQCDKCKKLPKFPTVKGFISHLRSIHNQETFTCVICEVKFQSTKAFDKHLKSHLKQCNQSKNRPPRNLPFSQEQPSHSKSNPDEIEIDVDFCNNENPNIHLKDSEVLENELCKKTTLFLTKLHAKDNFSRKDVLIVKDEVTKITNYVSEELKNLNLDIPPEKKSNYEILIKVLKEPFKDRETDYKFISFLKRSGLYMEPMEFKVTNEKGSFYILPIKFWLKAFLEIPKVFEIICNNLTESLQAKEFVNFVNGSRFQKIQSRNLEKIMLPYIMYMDDFEVVDSIGPHGGTYSIKAVYFKLLNLPKELNSKLDYIFPLMFSKKLLFKEKNIHFRELIKMLNELYTEGIELKFPEKTVKVYFCVALIVGDHLELNKSLGFASPSSNLYCRLCKRHKDLLKFDTKEFKECIRSIDSYNSDVQLKDFKSTGIREKCIFNELEGFHVTENFISDPMHDLMEGIFHYVICKTLYYFILVKKYFSFKTLNDRKANFKYSRTDQKSSTDINCKHITKGKLKMTASETKTFVRIFISLISDLVPNDEREKLELIKKLNIIMDIVMQFSITNNDLLILDKTIQQFLKSYVKIFDSNLTPKFHYLVHYTSMIKRNGPLRHLHCMRFESKHHQYKEYAKCVTGFQNITLSISKKASHKMTQFLLSEYENPLC